MYPSRKFRYCSCRKSLSYGYCFNTIASRSPSLSTSAQLLVTLMAESVAIGEPVYLLKAHFCCSHTEYSLYSFFCQWQKIVIAVVVKINPAGCPGVCTVFGNDIIVVFTKNKLGYLVVFALTTSAVTVCCTWLSTLPVTTTVSTVVLMVPLIGVPELLEPDALHFVSTVYCDCGLEPGCL